MSTAIPSGAAPSSSPGPAATTSSSSSSFLFPQTFSPPSSTTATPSSTSSPAGGSTGGVPSIASSASLYLYTFLATLVLLLSVSAAIVARSFVLRRRHRLMMEEAIRNGTWIPPVPGSGASRPRVDLSKKPVMWEAYLGGGERSAYLHNGNKLVQPDVSSASSADADKDWENIKPIFAAYLSKAPTPAPLPLPSASDLRPPEPPATMETRLNNLVDWAARIISPTPATPLSPLPAPLGNGNMQDVSTTTEDERGPPRVRVAVLIAMPSPHHSSPSTSRDRLIQNSEEELPHLEMGVATLPVLSHEGEEVHTHKGKNSIGSRDSASLE